MTEWQKLTEEQMDEFIMFVLKTLGIKSWSGIDMADIYEKAVSLSLQKTAHNSDYTKCPDCGSENIEYLGDGTYGCLNCDTHFA